MTEKRVCHCTVSSVFARANSFASATADTAVAPLDCYPPLNHARHRATCEQTKRLGERQRQHCAICRSVDLRGDVVYLRRVYCIPQSYHHKRGGWERLCVVGVADH